jgi:hypothetical protein
MAYTVEILEDNDAVTPDLLARPLADNGHWANGDKDSYEWLPVTDYLGNCWLTGKYTVGQLKNSRIPLLYEFMRKISSDGVVSFYKGEAEEWRKLFLEQRGGQIFTKLQCDLVALRKENRRLAQSVNW